MEYTDKSIQSIKDDRDRVRQSPTLFIPDQGPAGVIHIIIEYLDNSIDDAAASKLGDSATVSIDTITRAITVTDNARGIPHGKLLDAFTVLSTSGKYNNLSSESAYNYSGGAFGYGAKLGTFLSKWLTVTSIRDGVSLSYEFKDGLLTGSKRQKVSKKEHGTTVSFLLDQDFVDIENLDFDEVRERIQEKSYCFPDLKLGFQLTEGEKVITNVVYTGCGIMSLISDIKPDTEVICFRDVQTQKVIVDFNKEPKDVDVLIDCAFGLKEDALETSSEEYTISYVNSIKTYDGGAHVDGLHEGFYKFFKEVMFPKLSQRDRELKITPKDVTAGLAAVIRVQLAKPTFAAQYKSKLTNPYVRTAVRNAVYAAMGSVKQSTLTAMASFICRVCRGRMASKKVRAKDVMSAFSPDRIENLARIVEDADKTVSPELILVEGKSAASLVSKARDRYNQAVYYVMLPRNDFDVKLLADNRPQLGKVLNDIADIVNLVPGKNCDVSTMRMNIYTLTDGDIDGANIRNHLLAPFAKFFRPAVEAGRIGTIIPPRYSFPDPDHPGKKIFISDKTQFYKYMLKRFVKKHTICHDGQRVTVDQLIVLVDMNFEYIDVLTDTSNLLCCDPKLLEYFGSRYHGSYKDQKLETWKKIAADLTDEIKVEMSGKYIRIYGGYSSVNSGISGIDVIFNSQFDKHFYDLHQLFIKNSSIPVEGYTIDGTGGKTMYDIMTLFNATVPKNVKVYKGLGEMNANDIWEACLNPATRHVAIYDFTNYEDDILKIGIIMSTREKESEMRKRLVDKLHLNSRILDT